MHAKFDKKKDRLQTPGPGFYENDNKSLKYHHASWKFGSSSREQPVAKNKNGVAIKEKIDTPGVGKYEVRSDVFNSSKIK